MKAKKIPANVSECCLWRKVSGVCLLFPCRVSPGYGSCEEPGSPPDHANITADGTERRHDGIGALPEPRDNGHGSSPVRDGTGSVQHHSHQPSRNVQYEHRNDPNVAASKPKWHEHPTQPRPGTKAARLWRAGYRDGEWFWSEHAGELGPQPAAPADEGAGGAGLAQASGPPQASKHYGDSPARCTKLATKEPAGAAWED